MNNNTIHGIQPSFMDRNANPGVDFNRYANGGWIDGATIPDEYSKWGTFLILRDRALNTVHAILQQLAAETGAKPGSIEQQVGDFFFAGMNEAKIEADGAKPLAGELARISRIRSVRALIDTAAHLQLSGIGVLFGFGGMSDFNDSSRVAAHIVQGGTSLPDRDYYLNRDKKSRELRGKYVEHVARMFVLLGESKHVAARHAKAVLAIETKLARAQMTKVDRRNPHNINNKMSVADFQKTVPSIDLARFFKQLGTPDFAELIVHQPKFFQALSSLLTKVSLADWKAYLRWHLIDGAADYLSSDFVNESFEFGGKTLSGAKVLQPRWKRVVSATNGALGEAVGQMYVKDNFPPESKIKVLALVENLRAALRDAINKLEWMSPETKANAIVKLEAFEARIGYPDSWEDYSELTITRDSFVGNVMAASAFAERKNLAKIGKEVDRSEWGMTPQTVNATYSPLKNQITFPAAILQAPFFDPRADDAANYGGIGVVIGHEMTHGFDDSGSKYDSFGNLKNWWTEDDMANFTARVALIIAQFSTFTVSGGAQVNGKLVAGEAAADLGGVKLGYNALLKALDGKRTTDANGFTDEQRFFIAFAQLWASLSRPEAEELQVKTDPHPPAQFRVNGTLANVPEFAQAFGLPADAPIMLPVEKRCQLW